MSAVLPQWTEKLYRPAGGEDHLGLANVASGRILAKLAPDINVLTVHPRYWSFYTFLLDEFWQRDDLPRSRSSWGRFYHPREAVFSIGAHLCDRPEHTRWGDWGGIMGARKISALVRRRLTLYKTDFKFMDNPLGGYGYYYAGSLAAMGLVALPLPAAGLKCDAPTPMGRVVANAFRNAIRETRYYKEFFSEDNIEIPEEVILEYARKSCLCQLQTPESPDRGLLRDLFLHGGTEESALARRQTLRFFLDVARQTDGHALTQNGFRRLIYFGSDGEGARYKPSDGLEPTARRWRLYQSREYYAFALNRLWRYVCEWGLERSQGGLLPVSLDDLWDHVTENADFAGLANEFGVDAPDVGPNSHISKLTDWAISIARVRGDLDSRWSMNAPINEHELYLWGSELDNPSAIISGMLALLCMVAVRLWAPSLEVRYLEGWAIVREGGALRRSMDAFNRELRRRSIAGTTVVETLRWILSEYVIQQHLRVAASKLREGTDTYRFQREGDKLHFFNQSTGVGLNSSRFEALSTVVHELGFVGRLTSKDHSLTKDGRLLLVSGDLPGHPITGGDFDG